MKQKQRTLQLSHCVDEQMSKRQFTCFLHNLSADVVRTNPLIKWMPDPNFGPNAFFTRGFAEGSLITLRPFVQDDVTGTRLVYSRKGKIICTATELNGNVGNPDHIATLHNRVAMMIQDATCDETATHQVDDRKDTTSTYQTVGEIFRKISADQLVDVLFGDKPSMLTFNIAKGSPEWLRREKLVRAIVAYMQNVAHKDVGIQMAGPVLKCLKDGHICGYVLTEPMVRIANASVKFPDNQFYSGLPPAEAALKFAADIVTHLVNRSW